MITCSLTPLGVGALPPRRLARTTPASPAAGFARLLALGPLRAASTPGSGPLAGGSEYPPKPLGSTPPPSAANYASTGGGSGFGSGEWGVLLGVRLYACISLYDSTCMWQEQGLGREAFLCFGVSKRRGGMMIVGLDS
jgi:hypothetical protein